MEWCAWKSMDSFWFLTSNLGHLIKFQSYKKLLKFCKENKIPVVFKDQPTKQDLKEDKQPESLKDFKIKTY